jgi:hypothetical protein
MHSFIHSFAFFSIVQLEVAHEKLSPLGFASEVHREKREEIAIIFQYFMSYHLQIPDMFQNALVIFAYSAALERQKQTEDEKRA